MITRRIFAACGICSGVGLIATGAGAQAQSAGSGGVRRNILARGDAPDSKYEVVQMIIDIDANTEVPRHTHPGFESATILSGQGDLYIEGRSDQTMTPGNMYLIPASTPHGVRKVTSPLRVAATYTVEKGKPILTPAPG
jgi:quercetin dioxygenase-like cupin family protein